MSRQLGKLLIERGWCDVPKSCHIKFKKNNLTFLFEVNMSRGRNGESGRETISIAHDLLYMMFNKKFVSPVYKWSTGYKTKTLEDDVDKVYDAEIEMLGGRRELIVDKEWLDSDYTYYMLSVIMFCFNLSWGVCIDAKREIKRMKWGRSGSCGGWIELGVRDPKSYAGRKKGAVAVNVAGEEVEESDEEYQIRYDHNVHWAVSHGYLWAYEEAEKERVLREGRKWNKEEKEKVIAKWKELVDNVNRG